VGTGHAVTELWTADRDFSRFAGVTDAPDTAWFVLFSDGVVSAFTKSVGYHLRAVRGGS
jgi:hypothetical protein